VVGLDDVAFDDRLTPLDDVHALGRQRERDLRDQQALAPRSEGHARLDGGVSPTIAHPLDASTHDPRRCSRIID
jgi:hypothetical protein